MDRKKLHSALPFVIVYDSTHYLSQISYNSDTNIAEQLFVFTIFFIIDDLGMSDYYNSNLKIITRIEISIRIY